MKTRRGAAGYLVRRLESSPPRSGGLLSLLQTGIISWRSWCSTTKQNIVHGSSAVSLWAAQTLLDGKDGRIVLAVPNIVLEEMEKNGIAFKPIREAELPEHLSTGGFSYYQLLRRVDPDHLYFNAPLPPALHVSLFCTIFEPHLNALRQIVDRYRARRVSRR